MRNKIIVSKYTENMKVATNEKKTMKKWSKAWAWQLQRRRGKPLTPKCLKDLDKACPSTKNMYLSYTLPFLDDYVKKSPYPKSTYSSSALFESIEYLDVIEDFSSNVQPWCLWMQIFMLYFDH